MKNPKNRNYKNKNAQTERRLAKIAKCAEYPCAYKKKYKKPLECEIAARKESLKAMVQLYTYRCPYCRFYHLTSSTPRG